MGTEAINVKSKPLLEQIRDSIWEELQLTTSGSSESHITLFVNRNGLKRIIKEMEEKTIGVSGEKWQSITQIIVYGYTINVKRSADIESSNEYYLSVAYKFK